MSKTILVNEEEGIMQISTMVSIDELKRRFLKKFPNLFYEGVFWDLEKALKFGASIAP